MQAADYILSRLADEEIDTAFLVYGGAMSELAEAFTRQTEIRYVVCQHEQAAIFAAEGYAKASGKPGLVIVTSGPGVGNIMTGLQNCYFDSVPLIALTGQVATNLMRPDGSPPRQLGFQETAAVGMARPVTKYAATVRLADALPVQLELAIRAARDGRPGPALLDLPVDIQRAQVPGGHPGAILAHPVADTTPAIKSALAGYAQDLAASKRPGILVGGGAWRAAKAVCDFAALHDIPVFRTWNALDVCPDSHPCYAGTVGTYGGPGRNFGIQNTDLLLILGCRISGRITGGRPETFARGAKKYIVDIDHGMTDPRWQQVKGDVNVCADVGDFLRGLDLDMPSSPHSLWMARCREWVKKYDPVRPHMLKEWHHYGFMRRLSERIPENAIITSDTGGNQIMMGHCFQSKAGQRIFSSNGNSPMGFSMCGAMGAWFAEPERPIICIIGDGGMQLNIQELQTIWHYQIPIKVFVIDNGVLGNTKAWQRVNKRAEIACGPDGYSAPAFRAIANAYGITSAFLDSWKRFDYVISQALAHEGPYVLDVWDEDRCQYEPRVSRWDTPIEDMQPFLPRDEFRANMFIEPMEGWKENK